MTTTAVLLAEAKAIRQKCQVSSDISQAVFNGWRLLPQLADALAAAVIAVESEWQFYKAAVADLAEAEARLAKAEAILREVAKCDHPVYREPAQEYFDGPSRPMEPGT